MSKKQENANVQLQLGNVIRNVKSTLDRILSLY